MQKSTEINIEKIKNSWTMQSIDPDAGIDAWDSVATDYVYDSRVNFQDDFFLRFMASKVTLTKNMTALDVGCGAGAYTMALASCITQADGVDYSPKMVELAQNYTADNGISNARFMERNWYTCDGEEFAGKYDIAFAHTTPAIADYSTFMKMVKASKRYCFFCKPSLRTDEVMDEVRRIAGVEKSKTDENVDYALDTIWAIGSTPELESNKVVWRSAKSLEDAATWYLGRLKTYYNMDSSLERRVIDYLESISCDSMVTETINTTLVNIFWSVEK